MSNDLIKHHRVPTLLTSRLRLRAIETKDAPSIFEMRSNLENMKFVKMSPYENTERALKFIKNVESDMDHGKVFYWVLELEGSLDVIGTICLWSFSKDRKNAEIGYELLSTMQGQGYADEALKAVIKFAKNELMLKQIDAVSHEDHSASLKLLTNNNFTLLGYLNEIDPSVKHGEKMKLYSITL
ncbi:GNAT family N-acetyltransferase [Fusibacter sp. 3D3]|uniref:GNAT family N-acetyltransferase n=1 Tax=Fusibacter sp. 3D3 TaxID=1048380 RepID=UPI000853073D|nr:GNAT family N-acetyltransferase [Fusibacter sp. 3D3]GAU78508.1 GNAT family acetyltransferase Bsu1853 [Fusibacter sp. 3D3]